MAKGRLSKAKSPILKTCENPLCTKGIDGRPKNFWAYENEKYCCPKCQKKANYLRSRELKRDGLLSKGS